MFRRVLAVVLLGLFLVPASSFAEPQATPPTKKSSSATKKVVWTAIGAGAGFAAGVFLGLNKFDDAINSDRKVWTTAIIGAAAGGVGGWLIGRHDESNRVKVERDGALARPIGITWESALAKTPPRR